jgi:hypothetical protein
VYLDLRNTWRRKTTVARLKARFGEHGVQAYYR